jgi:hypothetical protein
MKTVWEVVSDNSTLDQGTFWQHLNHQGGGSGETILVEAIREASIVSAVSASVATPQLAAEVLSIATASVAAPVLSATVTSTTEAEL